MAMGNVQYGNNSNIAGINNSAGDFTTLTSTVPPNPAGIPVATLLVRNTGSGSAVTGEQTGNSVQPAVAGANAAGIGVSGDSEVGTGVAGGSDSGNGVFGVSARRNGVEGQSSSSMASGVYGENDGGGFGTAGRSSGGVTSAGVLGDNTGFGAGVLGISASGYAGVFLGTPAGGATPATAGGLRVVGNIDKSGGDFCEALPHPDGSLRRMYAQMGADSWCEDVGRVQMKSGTSRVELDPDFVAVLGIAGDGYHVFLTPEGDSNGLFVSRRTPTEFEVREQGGGDSDLMFSYRVMARRSNPPRRLAILAEPEGLLARRELTSTAARPLTGQQKD
jgi:hypothetical protein